MGESSNQIHIADVSVCYESTSFFVTTEHLNEPPYPCNGWSTVMMGALCLSTIHLALATESIVISPQYRISGHFLHNCRSSKLWNTDRNGINHVRLYHCLLYQPGGTFLPTNTPQSSFTSRDLFFPEEKRIVRHEDLPLAVLWACYKLLSSLFSEYPRPLRSDVCQEICVFVEGICTDSEDLYGLAPTWGWTKAWHFLVAVGAQVK